MTLRKTLTALAAVLAGGIVAAPALASKAETHGVVRVEDNAAIFSKDGVQKAKDHFDGTTFKATTHFTVVTYDRVPDAKRADYDLVKGDKGRKAEFMHSWAVEIYKAKREQGILALICSEAGSVPVVTDRASDLHRRFGDDHVDHLVKTFVAGMSEGKGKNKEDAAAVHDAALMKAVEYVSAELKDTTLPEKATGSNRADNTGGSSIMSYVCIGIVVLLGIWLVVGLIRAFTGGGGGYGGGGGGGGMMGGGYGGGGGGFFSSLIGGMFGAAAGMYMYDHFFGHNSPSMSGGDYGGSTGGDNLDTGVGDVDGGASGGGDFGGDDAGGGGDFGGGDFGGGGGDFGSGGGDFGGGGGGDFGGGDW